MLKKTEQNTQQPESLHTYVRVESDGSAAWLYLETRDKGNFYTKNELYQILSESQVLEGIEHAVLSEVLRKKICDREVKVACMIPPEQGRDGYFEYFFDTSRERPTPKIRPDGSVDYQSMHALRTVKKGDVVAVYHPKTEGKQGNSIFGGRIPAEPVMDLPPLQGRNLEHPEGNSHVYLAAVDGKIEYSEGTISIQKVHEVREDVTTVQGRIEFPGDVIIYGNVEPGVKIRVGKSLVIEGTVQGACLFAGGDIVLKRGIQGSGCAKIETRGNFYADFIEHAEVKAEKNVEANSILTSVVSARGKVVISGRKGCVIGGIIHGLKGVECREIGNALGIRTVVHAGVSQETLWSYRNNGKSEKALMEKLETSNQSREELLLQLSDIRQERAECEELMDLAKGAVIRVEGRIFRGSVVGIDNNQLPISGDTSSMQYRNVSGMLVGTVLAAK